jgi:hypothetical protein
MTGAVDFYISSHWVVREALNQDIEQAWDSYSKQTIKNMMLAL